MATCQSCLKQIPDQVGHCPYCGAANQAAQQPADQKRTVFGYAPAPGEMQQFMQNQQAQAGQPAPQQPGAMPPPVQQPQPPMQQPQPPMQQPQPPMQQPQPPMQQPPMQQPMQQPQQPMQQPGSDAMAATLFAPGGVPAPMGPNPGAPGAAVPGPGAPASGAPAGPFGGAAAQAPTAAPGTPVGPFGGAPGAQFGAAGAPPAGGPAPFAPGPGAPGTPMGPAGGPADPNQMFAPPRGQAPDAGQVGASGGAFPATVVPPGGAAPDAVAAQPGMNPYSPPGVQDAPTAAPGNYKKVNKVNSALWIILGPGMFFVGAALTGIAVANMSHMHELLYFSWIPFLVGGIFQLILMGKAWGSIQDGQTGRGAGAAVGLCFVPIFGPIWFAFFAVGQYGKYYDEFAKRNGLKTNSMSGAFTLAGILCFFLGAIGMIIATINFCKAINNLAKAMK